MPLLVISMLRQNGAGSITTGDNSPRLQNWSPKVVCRLGIATVLASSLTGCGTGLFGPKIHTVAVVKTSAAPESPLPPVQLDPKLVKQGQNVLYGRVVINGKPAKKGSVMICAASLDDIQSDPAGVIMQKRRGDGAGKNAKKRYSVQISNDDGLYVIEGVPATQYKVFCQFGPSFVGKESKIINYADPTLSPFNVRVAEGENMQDIVMEIEGAESLGVIKK
ncbi:hypothetical protein [Planctomicrobium piriforme]|nr:hypothetical protein [Planctomicrobium piriforme]